MTRQTAIRRTLTAQYRAGAVNEVLVARLRHEMSGLPHRHRWLAGPADSRECMWCFAGTDRMFRTEAEVVAEAREASRRSDAVLARSLAGPSPEERETERLAAAERVRVKRAVRRHMDFHIAPAEWCPACRAIVAMDPPRCPACGDVIEGPDHSRSH